uniref:Fish-egg lectin n=1 Tax=Oplegnathus fasciatus TaxID=163134 RepID=H3JU40_OPLFA|nr:Fish-egg lectin [Oplegnathus fasciatus]
MCIAGYTLRDDMKAAAAFLLVLCYLAVSQAWNCKEAPQQYPALQIDAGQGKVVLTDKNHNAYFLSGSTWYRLGSYSLKHVSVGPAGIWGVDTSNKVYKYVAGNFLLSNGPSMLQVDAGGNGQVVGVSNSYTNYCLRSTFASAYRKVGSLTWNSLSRVVKYYSCGPLYGCWGVDASDRIYFTQRIIPTTCGTSGWTQISGSAKMVEVGTDGTVFTVNRQGLVFQRTGIYNGRPQGSGWTQVSMCMKINHVSYDLGNLWAVTTSGLLFQCTH